MTVTSGVPKFPIGEGNESIAVIVDAHMTKMGINYAERRS